MAAIGMVIISKIVSLLIFRISPYVVADIGRFIRLRRSPPQSRSKHLSNPDSRSAIPNIQILLSGCGTE